VTDAGTILAYLADAVVVIGGVVALYLWLSGRFKRHEEAHLTADTGVALLLSDLATRNKQLKVPALEMVHQIAARETRVRPKVEAWEKAAIHGNPLTAAEVARRQQLTQQIQAGQALPVKELQELLDLLNRELAEAREAQAAAIVVVGIVLLIALVIAAIAAASS
jgi:hypothetical protein